MQTQGKHVSGNVLHEIMREIDTNRNGQVEVEEYLQMMSCIKHGVVAHSMFADVAMQNVGQDKYGQRMERSGGGV